MRNTFTMAALDRATCALLIALMPTLGCPPTRERMAPEAGLPRYQERAVLEVPGAVVNPLGGNLLVRRTDLSIDTHLGTREIGATYNSASGKWLWSFDIEYDGAAFVDPTGASHDVSTLAPGDAIPGTVWVVVDEDTVKTKGGLAHEFGPDSRLRAVHYTSSEYPRLAYTSEMIDGESHTVEIDQCMTPGDCEPVFEISHGESGHVTSIGDRAGRRTEIEYSGDLPVRVRDGLDTSRGWPGARYEYSGSRLTAMTSSEGERVEYGYSGRRVQEVRAIGEENPVHRFDYYVKNQEGLYATRYIDPLGYVTWFRYDGQRRLHQVEAADVGERIRLVWEGFGVAAEIQPSGVTTRWSYLDGDVATEVQASGNVVRFSYAASAVNRGNIVERALLEIADSIGLRERRRYDAAGRLVAIENGEGELVAGYSYAPDQTVASLTTANGVTTYADYGAHGHPTRLIRAGVEIVNDHDPVGNLRQGWNGTTPELGGVVSREYDEDRNLVRIAVTDAGLGGFPLHPEEHIDISHRSDGRRARIARPGGGDHEFGYDDLGRLIEVRERVDGAWESTRFEYDAAGRRTATQRANGMRREIGYDAVGRIASILSSRDGVVEASATLGYADGRLRSLGDSVRGGSERYSYDSAGRVETIEYPDGELLLIGYDLRSRKTREVFLADSLLRQFDRGHDLADRVVSVSDSGEPLIEHDYRDGKLVETRHGNGLVRSYRYGSNGELVGSRTEGPGGVVEETSITREGGGAFSPGLHVTAVTTTSGGVTATTTEGYGVGPGADAGGEEPVVGKRVWMWSDGADWSAYEYDALGNRRGVSALAESFEYNAEGNRLLSATGGAAGTVDYSYDEAGFVTSRRGVPLTWTASGRLASHGSDVIFEWDALDRRVRSVVMGAETRWLFGGRVQADASGLPVSIDLGEVRVDLATSRRLYRHPDFRGNVKFVSDEAGEILNHYQYDAYGLRQVLGSEEDPVRFVGRSQIGELMVLGARIYDPAVGRFLSPDPVLQRVNQYAYALGNPVWFADPSGRDFESILEGILATGGLATATLALFAVPGPGTAALAGLAFTISVLNFSFWLTHALAGSLVGPQHVFPPAPSGLGSRALQGISETSQSCSPVRLASVPGLGSLHWALIAAQLLLAPLLIRSWAVRRRRRSR